VVIVNPGWHGLLLKLLARYFAPFVPLKSKALALPFLLGALAISFKK
jgi:hypothetical protein